MSASNETAQKRETTMATTVVPMHGRDYKTLKAAQEDWFDGKDFAICDLHDEYDTKPVNIQQAKEEGRVYKVRFCRNTKQGLLSNEIPAVRITPKKLHKAMVESGVITEKSDELDVVITNTLPDGTTSKSVAKRLAVQKARVHQSGDLTPSDEFLGRCTAIAYADGSKSKQQLGPLAKATIEAGKKFVKAHDRTLDSSNMGGSGVYAEDDNLYVFNGAACSILKRTPSTIDEVFDTLRDSVPKKERTEVNLSRLKELLGKFNPESSTTFSVDADLLVRLLALARKNTDEMNKLTVTVIVKGGVPVLCMEMNHDKMYLMSVR